MNPISNYLINNYKFLSMNFNKIVSNFKKIITSLLIMFIVAFIFTSCENNILSERPLSEVSAVNTLNSKAGFEAYLIGLVRNAREEYTQDDVTFFITNFPGTD